MDVDLNCNDKIRLRTQLAPLHISPYRILQRPFCCCNLAPEGDQLWDRRGVSCLQFWCKSSMRAKSAAIWKYDNDCNWLSVSRYLCLSREVAAHYSPQMGATATFPVEARANSNQTSWGRILSTWLYIRCYLTENYLDNINKIQSTSWARSSLGVFCGNKYII